MAKEYTQTVKPVSRIAEKIFGWLGWLLLLLLTAGILFFSLVSMNDPATTDDMTTAMEQQLQNMELEGVDPQSVIDISLSWLSNSWVVALYLALPLIISLLALLNMKRRILAGILLLIAAVLAAPIMFTLISSLFFVIAAILLFARKDMVVKNDSRPEELRDEPRGGRNNDDPRAGRNNDDQYRDRNDADQHRGRGSNNEEQNRVMTPPADDDVKVRTTRNNDYNYDDKNTKTDSDIESTRKFQRIEDAEDGPAVDHNIDSQNIDRPVTDREYKRQSGVELEDLNDMDREDPSQTRRDNVDRRNRK